MSDKDPDSNGGLPPKISLKPKSSDSKPDEPVKSAEEAAKHNVAQSDKTATSQQSAPSSPQKPMAPKPIEIKKSTGGDTSAPSGTEDPAEKQPEENAPSMAERALKEAELEEKQSKRENAQTAKPAPSPTGSAKDSTGQADKQDDQQDAQKPGPASPKRPVLRPAGSGASPIKKPTPVGIKKDGADPLAAPGTKKSTSRITLPSAAEKSTTAQIKTIKIPPKSKTGKIETQSDQEEADGKQPTIDPKRQTSRISLESVLGGSGSSKSPNAPSTIKIKRAAPQAGEADDAKTIKAPDADTAQDSEQTKTVSDASSEAKPESQKKTLKVKRPAVSSSDRPTVSGASSMFTPPVPTGNAEPEPHWAFAVLGLVATIVAGVLIYVLTAQVLDVDLAEAPPGEGLPWPARYTP